MDPGGPTRILESTLAPLEIVSVRARRTLNLMHGWGYAPTIQTLADNLLGGAISVPSLLRAVCANEEIEIVDDFVFLPERQDLLEESRHRVASHRRLNGTARNIAHSFAADLGRACPLIDCIALSGSVASGGYDPGDDIDLNLFVSDGAKYLVYAIALLLGLRTILIHRKSRGLRKLICINVLWTRNEAQPFRRQDEGLAFELLRSQPILGAEHFRRVIAANPWLDAFFPQIRARLDSSPPIPPPRRFGKVVVWIADHPGLLRAFDRAARIATRAAYACAHWWRRNDAERAERLRFLQRVKYPYEVFQD